MWSVWGAAHLRRNHVRCWTYRENACLAAIGKALGAGVQPIAATLCNQRVVNAISAGSGYFAHGHTYENHAIVCAVGNEVLNIIRGLIPNIEAQGQLLGSLLREGLEKHPNVGNIRGMGLF
jgi:adenosylmethionine-8-amino-7-oxononanoate aminotransferase